MSDKSILTGFVSWSATTIADSPNGLYRALRPLSDPLNDRFGFILDLKRPSDLARSFAGVFSQDRGKVAGIRNRSTDRDRRVDGDPA
jgi:hypothetical protein